MSNPTSNRIPALRLLLVEDDLGRVARFEKWLPDDVLLVKAASAGQAMGLLKRDRGNVYAGVLLDYDLHLQALTDVDRHFNGGHVAQAMITHLDPCDVLIHSMNATGGGLMETLLHGEGFPVRRVPFGDLTAKKLLEWLAEVREVFLDEHGD